MTLSRFAAICCSLLFCGTLSLTASADATATRPSSRPTSRPAFVYAPAEVTPVPQAERERLGLSPFYAQYASIGGFPIVASAKVDPHALKEAAYLIGQMLDGRGDILQAMTDTRTHLTVMAVTEFTTDVPEHSHLTPKAHWDRRARGLGATREVPCVSCGEENLLALKGDPYFTESILVHEFAHAIHDTGLSAIDPTFDRRLEAAYNAAMAEGLWKNTYAATNRWEYWAEVTQSWFDTNRSNDAWHGEIDTRDEVKQYDPRAAALLTEVYGDRPWRYVRPDRRAEPAHLAGFDRAKAARFAWPATQPSTQPATTKSSH